MAAQIIEKRVQVYVIDAYQVAQKAGLGRRTNTVMQTCYFALAKILDPQKAIDEIKRTIEYTYGKKGAELVRKNMAAVDEAVANIKKLNPPSSVNGHHKRPPLVSTKAPDFAQRVTATILAGKGDLLPVSAFPVDGTWPTATISGKSETSPLKYRCGIQASVFSATSARWPARMRPFAPKSTTMMLARHGLASRA